jgi:hypothetical protein
MFLSERRSLQDLVRGPSMKSLDMAAMAVTLNRLPRDCHQKIRLIRIHMRNQRNLTYGRRPVGCRFKSLGNEGAYTPQFEQLEVRWAPAAPVVLSIGLAAPAARDAASVQFALTFSQAVTGVDASDFAVVAADNLKAATPVVVSGNGAVYTVSVNGIRGNGTLRLDLIDNNSIAAAGLALGGAAMGDGSFQGQSCSILQTYPTVASINRAAPAVATTNAVDVSFTVTFSKPVTGVDAADFRTAKTGAVAVGAIQVSPTSASVYTVTIHGITGDGSLRLDLVDDGTIRDQSGNPLVAADLRTSLSPPTNFATGNNPNSVTIRDFNGDGNQDLAVGNYQDGTISVFLGDGHGRFQEQQTFAGPSQNYALAADDLNGDGKADLALVSMTYNTVSVLLGNGDGAFQAATAYATDAAPNDLVLTDVSGDGKPDLITGNFGSDTISVLLGNGDGTFRPQQTFHAGQKANAVAVGDVNGDGKLDAVTANFLVPATVNVLLGNGDGTFQTRKSFATEAYSDSVTLGDVNNDGKLDIAAANFASIDGLMLGNGTVSVLLGNGNGTFQPQKTFTSGAGTTSVTLGDINGDGNLDIMSANSPYPANTVNVLLGNGNGTFQFRQLFEADASAFELAFGDVNGDGKPDLATADHYTPAVSVLLGSSSGAFQGQTYTLDHSLTSTTTTALTAIPNATTGGTLVTLTATVAPSPVNAGSVAFKDNGAVIASGISLVNGEAVFQTQSLAVGTHSLVADYSGASGFSASTSSAVTVTITGAGAPQLVGVVINGNVPAFVGSQHSRIVGIAGTFDRPVELDAGAFALALHTNAVVFGGIVQPTGLGAIPTSLALSSSDNATWLVTFVGNTDAGADTYNSLKDGVYDFHINAAKVHPAGIASVGMAADSTTTFHRLFGDIDDPATPTGGVAGVDFSTVVNTGDNFAFRSAFNRPTPDYKAFLDFDGNGIVNTGDNFELRNRFNKTLAWKA